MFVFAESTAPLRPFGFVFGVHLDSKCRLKVARHEYDVICGWPPIKIKIRWLAIAVTQRPELEINPLASYVCNCVASNTTS